jgi:hypothetical protein
MCVYDSMRLLGNLTLNNRNLEKETPKKQNVKSNYNTMASLRRIKEGNHSEYTRLSIYAVFAFQKIAAYVGNT